jgi:hypothetical protein
MGCNLPRVQALLQLACVLCVMTSGNCPLGNCAAAKYKGYCLHFLVSSNYLHLHHHTYHVLTAYIVMVSEAFSLHWRNSDTSAAHTLPLAEICCSAARVSSKSMSGARGACLPMMRSQGVCILSPAEHFRPGIEAKGS